MNPGNGSGVNGGWSRAKLALIRGHATAVLRSERRRLLLDTVLLGIAGVGAAQLFNLLLGLSRTVFLGIIADGPRAVARPHLHHPA